MNHREWSHTKRVKRCRIPGHVHLLTVNPVLKRLVAVPEAWIWSSYRWLMDGERVGVPVLIDGWDTEFLEDEVEATA